jgi:DNA-binding SARP family transcriptional activator
LALAARPLSRRQLASELFADADDPLGALRWTLAELRRRLGSSEFLRGDPLTLDLPGSVLVDVVALEDGSIDPLQLEGDLLEGVDPAGGPEFASWLLVERQRVAARLDAALRHSALQAMSLGDAPRAVELSRRLVTRAPFDEAAHVLLVKALALADLPEAAAEAIAACEQLFRSELGVLPSSALRSAARPRVADAVPGVSAAAVAVSLQEAGRAALDAGATDAGIDVLRRAAAEAERSGDRRLHATVLLDLGRALVHSVRGHDDEGAVLLRMAADLADASGDGQVGGEALRLLGYVDVLAGRRPSAARLLAEAESRAGGEPGLVGSIEAVRGLNLADWGRLGEAEESFRRSLEAARTAGRTGQAAWTLANGGRTLLLEGDTGQARRWLRESLEMVSSERWTSYRTLAGSAARRGGSGGGPTSGGGAHSAGADLRPQLRDR